MSDGESIAHPRNKRQDIASAQCEDAAEVERLARDAPHPLGGEESDSSGTAGEKLLMPFVRMGPSNWPFNGRALRIDEPNDRDDQQPSRNGSTSVGRALVHGTTPSR